MSKACGFEQELLHFADLSSLFDILRFATAPKWVAGKRLTLNPTSR
jgi:hypothetical protein